MPNTDTRKNHKIIVAHLGARRHYAEAEIFFRAGNLCRLYTDAYLGNKNLLSNLINIIPDQYKTLLIKSVLGRNSKVINPELVKGFNFLGIYYASIIRFYALVRKHPTDRFHLDISRKFAKNIIKAGFDDCKYLWAYNRGAFDLFNYVKNNNKAVNCILDQTSLPSIFEATIEKEENDKWRDWLVPGVQAIDNHEFIRVEKLEWDLAHTIVCGSQYVKNSLIECSVPEEKIHVIPSGVELQTFEAVSNKDDLINRPIRVLFVGRVSVMKGIPYLLLALKKLGAINVQARLIGHTSIVPKILNMYADVAQVVGYVPRVDIIREYAWADVFCFPSLMEGSATVTYEALASGLPVITTSNAGSLVRDGITGFIVPPRDPDAIASAIFEYISNPDLLRRHQCNVVLHRKDVGLERYAEDILSFVNGIAASN